MPLRNYSVLKGRPIAIRQGSGNSPHYQIHVAAGDDDFRIAVNVESSDGSEVEYLVRPRFEHPIIPELAELPQGLRGLPPRPGGIALDYIRSNFMQPQEMLPLPVSAPGPDNDLNEALDRFVQRALADEQALIYAFGETWGPERQADRYFGFRPGRGIHDIHMNQGNPSPPQGQQQWFQDNGPWQDGGLVLEFPAQAQWVAMFLKFQTQAWHTDDTTGRPLTLAEGEPAASQRIPPNAVPTLDQPDGLVRIMAALVNDVGSPEHETVTLLNTVERPIDLTGWALVDRQRNRMPLTGTLEAGSTRRIDVALPVQLSNRGGTITLLDERGVRVHGVSYTREQARTPGLTIVF